MHIYRSVVFNHRRIGAEGLLCSKTCKPKTGPTTDRSNQRQVKPKTWVKPKTGANPRQGQTQDNINITKKGNIGTQGAKFFFTALQPAVSKIVLSDFILKPKTFLL